MILLVPINAVMAMKTKTYQVRSFCYVTMILRNMYYRDFFLQVYYMLSGKNLTSELNMFPSTVGNIFE